MAVRARVILTRLSPQLFRTHPSHPRSRDAKAALTRFSRSHPIIGLGQATRWKFNSRVSIMSARLTFFSLVVDPSKSLPKTVAHNVFVALPAFGLKLGQWLLCMDEDDLPRGLDSVTKPNI